MSCENSTSTTKRVYAYCDVSHTFFLSNVRCRERKLKSQNQLSFKQIEEQFFFFHALMIMAEKSNQQTFLQVKISRSPNFDPKVVLCTLHTSHARSILKLKLQIPHQGFRILVNIVLSSSHVSTFIEITNLLHIFDIKRTYQQPWDDKTKKSETSIITGYLILNWHL